MLKVDFFVFVSLEYSLEIVFVVNNKLWYTDIVVNYYYSSSYTIVYILFIIVACTIIGFSKQSSTINIEFTKDFT